MQKFAITIVLDADDPEELGDAVNALALINAGQMRRAHARGKPLPPLYGGSIRYVQEKPGKEHWKTAREVAQSGRGDCEDLGAYYVAQSIVDLNLQARGFATRVNDALIHIRVRLPDGQIIDPSARLGMKGSL